MTVLPPLRAPASDGAILAVPPLAEAGRLLAANRERAGQVSQTLLGRSWQDVRALARRELLGASADQPVFLAGHQPELFHPGVWVKNFALAGLARKHRGTAVNLVVDNDTMKSTGVMVPVRGPEGWPRLQTVLFDSWTGDVPWEERRILDEPRFARFGEEVTELLHPWGFQPLISTFWPEVRRQAARHEGKLGASFAAARRALERSWGVENREVPLSEVCQFEAFAWLAGTLLAELPRFVEVYNSAAHDYRRRNGIRSLHHPVPDLAAEGDWLELPLWGWQAATPTPRRGRLFARRGPAGIELRAGDRTWPGVPLPEKETGRFLDAWRSLESAGYKLRSRALLTTLFARLFLGDLFLHGIGGGKYDELTDVIVQRFWRIPPPAFMVVSATCWLPLPDHAVGPADWQRQVRRMRDLHWNPQQQLPPDADLVRAKSEWIERTPPTRAGRRQRYHQLRRLTEQMRAQVAGQETAAQKDLEHLEKELSANAILHRRDYAFCLYPESALRPLCLELARGG